MLPRSFDTVRSLQIQSEASWNVRRLKKVLYLQVSVITDTTQHLEQQMLLPSNILAIVVTDIKMNC